MCAMPRTRSIVRKEVRHMVFFLLGLFLFPLLAQPLHVLHHREHHSQCVHSKCSHKSAEKSCCDEGLLVLSAKEELCPICHYQFSINELPQPFLYTFTRLPYAFINNERLMQQNAVRVFSLKTLRAPPFA